MKKNLLLIMWCIPAALVAQTQNGVKVEGLAVDAGTVTFNVSWDKPMPVEVWSDSVWVFVDYNKNGVMTRLPVTSATASAGTVTKIPGNDKGVWVAGNARTNDSFSAKVELFTEIKDVAGACAYASNYPPVGKYTSATEISFTGTPGYDLVFAGGATTHTESNPYTVPSGSTVQSFTDKTGAPGRMKCMPMTVSNNNIDFSMLPAVVTTGRSASFSVTQPPSNPAAVSYTWSAPGFSPPSFTGSYNVAYVATAPDAEGLYEVIVTAHSAGYCDLTKKNSVKIWDCRLATGRIGTDPVVCTDGNTGGKIGI